MITKIFYKICPKFPEDCNTQDGPRKHTQVTWPTDKIKWNIQLEHLKYEGLNLISKSLIYIQ
jgi:hypothetical protein